MFTKLPAAWLSGLRVREVGEARAVVTVPFKWLTQNPFKSIYFACQAMAAEMSTGVLAMGHIYESKPAVSMLVTGMQATFFKKGTSKVFFTCNDGLAIKNAVKKAIESGEGQKVLVTSRGTNSSGELISEFKIEWSFKARNPKA